MTPKATIKDIARFLLKDDDTQEIDNIVDNLSVQGKFKEMIRLEEDNKTWNNLVTALPVVQLSFILRADMDCLPTLLNLKCWSYIADSLSKLCNSSQPTSPNNLNGC